MSDQRLLRLGAQTAEVEALYARVLEAADPHAERERLTALAEAAARLAAGARTAARNDRMPGSRVTAPLPASRTRLARRITHARRATERIITRSREPPADR